MGIVYHVLSHQAETHRVSFRIDLAASDTGVTELVLPTWAPGSYEIRESAREVRELHARTGAHGASLPVERVAKNRWRVAAPAGTSLEVGYEVYGHDLLDDGLEADAQHLYLNAARCFPCVEGRREEPVELVLHLPPAWRAYAELPQVGEHPVRFRATDYDELLDTPIDCGSPLLIEFRPRGIRHRLLLCGGPGNFDAHRIEQDLSQLVEATIAYIGESPLQSYTFFTHLSDGRRSGLEHRASTSLIVNRLMFQPRDSYEEFLLLCAHEYFHLYNVKRIQPAVLQKPPLDRECYTRLLWLMEGSTDYVGWMLLRHAGLEPPARTREKLAARVRTYHLVPGRLVKSLEEASLTSWIDLYHPYEESRNQSVSYYLKGGLVSWCLDLEILSRTETRSSFQSVMRHLWTEYGKTGRGIPEEAAPAIFERATGLDLRELFDRLVRGTEEVDFTRFARLAGLTCEPAPRPEAVDKPLPGYLGVEVALERGEVRVREVLDGTPARRAGITPGDELVAIDGMRVTAATFHERMTRIPPGTATELTLFRRGAIQSVALTAGTPPPEKYRIEPVAEATPLERKVYEAWMKAPWEPPRPATENPTG
ncbi:MAG: PDZ domain-containing protein [Thermoplasmata archaeon]|nr:PDZ domain-containing protein [Thermoplasmata archaeon]